MTGNSMYMLICVIISSALCLPYDLTFWLHAFCVVCIILSYALVFVCLPSQACCYKDNVCLCRCALSPLVMLRLLQ